MRFLFKIPRHQQFHIKPRYYDPIKEEIKERTERIKQRVDNNETKDYQPGSISFKRKTKSATNASLTQLGIATLLGALAIGWLYLGSDVFYYIAWVAILLYFIYRLKSIRKRK